MLKVEEFTDDQVSITIVGIGSKGVRAVSKMSLCIKDARYLLVPDDYAEIEKMRIGNRTRVLDLIASGCAVGGDLLGCDSPREDSVLDDVKGADLVFIVTGMENQAVADMTANFTLEIRDAGAFIIAVVPGDLDQFSPNICSDSVAYPQEFLSCTNSIIALSNASLVPLHGGQNILSESGLADYLVRHAVGQIVRCLIEQSIICLDYADIKVVFGDGDRTYMGLGLANGPTKGKDALLKAVKGLTQQGLNVAQSVGLFTTVEGSTNMTMDDFDEVSRALIELIPEDLNIIFGCNFDDALGENMRVTVFASFTN